MLTLYHDIPSAASLCAVLRLQRLADDGMAVQFRGFDVLGIDTTIPATLDDLEDWQNHRELAQELGWSLARPTVHPSTLTAHLLADLADEHDLGAAWRHTVYRAHWREGADIGDHDVLEGLATSIGLPDSEVARLLDDPAGRHRLRKQMLVHRGDGVGGVPVLDVNGTFVSPFMPEGDLRELARL